MADARQIEFVEPLRIDPAITAPNLDSIEDTVEHPRPAVAHNHDVKTSISISASSRKCLSSYTALGDEIQDATPEDAAKIGFETQSALSLVLDARVRFTAWAKSIAALHPEHLKSSLDARLKDAKDIRESILRVLGDLQTSLHTASLIVTGERPNLRWSLDSMSDDESEEEDEDKDENSDNESRQIADGAKGEEEANDSGDENDVLERWTSELEQLFSAIEFANASLMKFSIVIRTSPARDDYLKAAARYNYDNSFKVYYINHVRDKHGHTMGDREWLIERMGTAITRRKQFLTYRKDHQGKLSRDWDEDEGDVKPGGKREHTVALTLATAYEEKKLDEILEGEEREGSFGSVTSYENTVVGEAAQKRTVPPPPSMAFEGIPFEYGEPFQCPYCYTEQVVQNRQAWKSHVFRDLKPYVCTFKECDLKMFKSRSEWFSHELQNHRREWSCISCGDTFANKTTFRNHLVNIHKVDDESRLKAMITQSEEPVDKILPSACLFCEDWEANLLHSRRDATRTFLGEGAKVKPTGSLGQFRRHLGHHLEQLALFALPINEGEDVQDDSEDDDNDREAPRSSSSASYAEVPIGNTEFPESVEQWNTSANPGFDSEPELLDLPEIAPGQEAYYLEEEDEDEEITFFKSIETDAEHREVSKDPIDTKGLEAIVDTLSKAESEKKGGNFNFAGHEPPEGYLMPEIRIRKDQVDTAYERLKASIYSKSQNPDDLYLAEGSDNGLPEPVMEDAPDPRTPKTTSPSKHRFKRTTTDPQEVFTAKPQVSDPGGDRVSAHADSRESDLNQAEPRKRDEHGQPELTEREEMIVRHEDTGATSNILGNIDEDDYKIDPKELERASKGLEELMERQRLEDERDRAADELWRTTRIAEDEKIKQLQDGLSRSEQQSEEELGPPSQDSADRPNVAKGTSTLHEEGVRRFNSTPGHLTAAHLNATQPQPQTGDTDRLRKIIASVFKQVLDGEAESQAENEEGGVISPQNMEKTESHLHSMGSHVSNDMMDIDGNAVTANVKGQARVMVGDTAYDALDANELQVGDVRKHGSSRETVLRVTEEDDKGKGKNINRERDRFVYPNPPDEYDTSKPIERERKPYTPPISRREMLEGEKYRLERDIALARIHHSATDMKLKLDRLEKELAFLKESQGAEAENRGLGRETLLEGHLPAQSSSPEHAIGERKKDRKGECDIRDCRETRSAGKRYCSRHCCNQPECDNLGAGNLTGGYCDEHKKNRKAKEKNVLRLKCDIASCDNWKAMDKRYCYQHCCTNPGCANPRQLGNQSNYCVEHYSQKSREQIRAEMQAVSSSDTNQAILENETDRFIAEHKFNTQKARTTKTGDSMVMSQQDIDVTSDKSLVEGMDPEFMDRMRDTWIERRLPGGRMVFVNLFDEKIVRWERPKGLVKPLLEQNLYVTSSGVESSGSTNTNTNTNRDEREVTTSPDSEQKQKLLNAMYQRLLEHTKRGGSDTNQEKPDRRTTGLDDERSRVEEEADEIEGGRGEDSS